MFSFPQSYRNQIFFKFAHLSFLCSLSGFCLAGLRTSCLARFLAPGLIFRCIQSLGFGCQSYPRLNYYYLPRYLVSRPTFHPPCSSFLILIYRSPRYLFVFCLRAEMKDSVSGILNFRSRIPVRESSQSLFHYQCSAIRSRETSNT